MCPYLQLPKGYERHRPDLVEQPTFNPQILSMESQESNQGLWIVDCAGTLQRANGQPKYLTSVLFRHRYPFIATTNQGEIQMVARKAPL